MHRMPSLKAVRFFLLTILLPFIFTADARMSKRPFVVNDDNYTRHGSGNIGPMLANDSDPDKNSLQSSIKAYPQHGAMNALMNDAAVSVPQNSGLSTSGLFVVAQSQDTVTLSGQVMGPWFVPVQGAIVTMTGYTVPRLGFVSCSQNVVNFNQTTTTDASGFYSFTVPAGYCAEFDFMPSLIGFTGSGASISGSVLWNSSGLDLHLSGNEKMGDTGNPGCAAVGRPVNVTNGNVYLQQTDYSSSGIRKALQVIRSYNSLSTQVGLFGLGWSTLYDESIAVSSDNLVRLYEPEGRASYFTRSGGVGAFTPYTGDVHAQIIKNADGSYTLSFQDGSVHQFNASGKLVSLMDRNGNQTTLTYNGNGFLTAVTDPFGHALTMNPNANGQVLSVSDDLGVIATYTYSGNLLTSVLYGDNSRFDFTYATADKLTTMKDALGHVIESHQYDQYSRAMYSETNGGAEHYTIQYLYYGETDVTDGLGNVTKYFYNQDGERSPLTQVQGACGCGAQTESMTYDAQLNLTSKTDALNHTTTYTYDANGNPLTITNALGTTTLTYNSLGEILTVTDPMNGVTTNTYDANGNLLTLKDALNNTTTFTYDTRGQLLTAKDALNNTTTLTWDTSGRLSQVKDAANNTTMYAYDARNRITSVTNALNEATSYQYDAASRLLKVTYPDTSYIQYTYDLGGRRTKVRDARGNETNFAYDEANRLTSVTNADNKTTTYAYDVMSHLTGVTDALSRTTNYEYDSLNRLDKITYPPATTGATQLTEQIAYDAASRVTSRTDEAGRVTTYDYDNANRLIKMTDPALQVTQYEYNARSQMTAVVDALNQRHAFSYDALGHVTQVSRGGSSMSYQYDAVGNRTQRTDYNNATTTYAYDNLNRLTTVTYPDTTTATYSYDALSRLSSATNENGTVSLGYDNRGRVNSTTDVFNQTVGYGYDANNNRTSLTLNGSNYATYSYDVLNRLTQITDSANLNVGFGYDATNKLTSRTLPNGVTSTYQYDGLDRLTRLTDATSMATVADAQYQYNTASQITQIAELSQTRNFNYDSVDRLTSVQNPTQTTESYTYDAVGNRTASHISSTYSYQSFNKVVTIGSTSYSYDNNGNLTSKTDGGGTWSYTWDYENRLKQVIRPDSTIVSYSYDALGRRIQRSKGNDWTKYVYDGDEVVKDINSDSSTVDYLNGLGVDDKLRQASSAGTYYFSQDHLGSTRVLTDSNGNAVESINYDSFGNGASSLTRYGYTGREWDGDTNLYYYRNRWYDPQMGRFISEDPIGLSGGINLFTYVRNNPLSFRDAKGLYPSISDQDYSDPYAGEYTERVLEERGCGCDSGGNNLLLGAGTIVLAGGGPEDPAADLVAFGYLTVGYLAAVASSPPVCTISEQDRAKPIPLAPPAPPPPQDGWEQVTVYRGLKAKNPSEFNRANDPDGLSTYEILNPGAYKLALPFTVRYRGPKVEGTVGYITSPPFAGAPAEYTPKLGDPRIGIGHWSLKLPGELEDLKQALSKYAKEKAGPY